MTELKLEQKAGDNSHLYQSAGDLTVNHNYLASSPDEIRHGYKKLVEAFEKELEEGNTEYLTYIDKIKHYLVKIDGLLTLEDKLKEAGFESYYKWASGLKESYFQKLTENDLSKASQKIHAFLLARICLIFQLTITGNIRDGVSKESINNLIMEKVVFPLENMLQEDNVLNLDSMDIMAMIYFLTGNCHIRWINL